MVYYQVLDVIRLCDWLVIFTVLAGNIIYQVMLLSVTSDSGSLSWAAVDGSLITFSWTCKIFDQVYNFLEATSSSMSGWDGLGSLVGAEVGGAAMVPSAWR